MCFNRSSENKAYLLDVGSAKIPVYCHMTKHGLDTCGGGGWTLVMKIDGSKVLRADVCKYRPGVGKIKISKNPKKIQWTTLGTLFTKI